MQASLELDIVSVEYDEDDMAMAGDMVSSRIDIPSYYLFVLKSSGSYFNFCFMHLITGHLQLFTSCKRFLLES